MSEVWKDIEGFEGRYEVSNLGNVWSIKTGINLAQTFCKSNYLKVKLCKPGEEKTVQVHRLVADAFVENSKNKSQVNHIDGDKTNNRADNLEWATPKENTSHAINIGLFIPAINEHLVQARKLQRKPIVAKHIITGETKEYESMALAARELGVKSPSISQHLKGKTKRVGKYTFNLVI